ncbi:DUF2892 domain-containing protein [Mycoplasmatota bacterium WC44]
MYIINGKGSIIRVIGGSFVLASVLLGYFVSEYFFLFTCLVGAFLILSGLTGFCLMEKILRKFGIEERTTVKKQ